MTTRDNTPLGFSVNTLADAIYEACFYGRSKVVTTSAPVQNYAAVVTPEGKVRGTYSSVRRAHLEARAQDTGRG